MRDGRRYVGVSGVQLEVKSQKASFGAKSPRATAETNGPKRGDRDERTMNQGAEADGRRVMVVGSTESIQAPSWVSVINDNT